MAATTGANVNTIVNAERRLAFTIWCTTSSSQRSFLVPTKITSGCFCGNSNHTLSSHTTGRSNRFNTENNRRNETTNSNDNKSAHKAWLEQERAALLDDASFLTRSVYRNCVRSIRLIRWGNASDERDFQEREEAQMRDLSASIMDRQKDQRFSMISMLPPVDREDELRSRAEYYGQYAREMFIQESDCLNDPVWDYEQHIQRYLFHIKRGDEHRAWLLQDMQFEDPYSQDVEKLAERRRQIQRFDARALRYVRSMQEYHRSPSPKSPWSPPPLLPVSMEDNSYTGIYADESEDEEGDNWFHDSDDEEEDESTLPSWYKNPQNE